MPKGNWGHAGHARWPESTRLFPRLEATPDLNRGEIRFAAEVALHQMNGIDVPSFAFERAVETLGELARG